ncbi:MAG: amidohydrolase family protein [Rhodospirillales bacterium]|nr:amidohydrolase family protein [Rhodospirillales bacterium]
MLYRVIKTAALLLIFAALAAPASNAQNPAKVVEREDADGDKKVSREEFRGQPGNFEKIDKNGDGFLTVNEFRVFFASKNKGGGKQGVQGNQSGPSRKKGTPGRPPDKDVSSRQPPTGAARFVDTHTHLHALGLDTTFGGQAFSGSRDDEAGNLAKAAKKLIKRMDEQLVKFALIVVVPSAKSGPEKSYELQRDTVRKHPDRLRLLAGGALLGPTLQQTDPGAVTDDIKRRFRATAEKLLDEGAVGFGEMLSYHLCMNPKHSFKYAAPDHPLYLLLADIAAERDVPIDLHMEAIEKGGPMPKQLKKRCDKNPDRFVPTIPGLEVLLRHNRKARVVWEHIGWDNTRQMTPRLMRRLLPAHPNLYLSLRAPQQTKTRDGKPFPNRIFDITGRTIKPEWKRLILDFPDRIMLGADEFVGPGEKAKLAASFEKTWSILEHFSGEVREKIGGGNARRVFKLDG